MRYNECLFFKWLFVTLLYSTTGCILITETEFVDTICILRCQTHRPESCVVLTQVFDPLILLIIINTSKDYYVSTNHDWFLPVLKKYFWRQFKVLTPSHWGNIILRSWRFQPSTTVHVVPWILKLVLEFLWNFEDVFLLVTGSGIGYWSMNKKQCRLLS